ncbi:MAG: lysophospholipid acyltransferase family protein [Verrucomicrobiales bacterium]
MQITRASDTSSAAAGARSSDASLPGKLYHWTRAFWRFAFLFTMRVKTRGMENVPARGGVILAVAHRSHLDPVVVSTLLDRDVGWMARVEFYRHRLWRAVLKAMGSFQVDRRRPGVAPVREAARRLGSGHVVGIFPEGEIQTGDDRVTHGGPIKAGAVYLAALTGCPILPVVVVGAEKLSSPWPWLPAKWGRLWVRVGEPLTIGPEARRRAGRLIANEQLREKFIQVYAQSDAEWRLPEGRGK